MTDKDRKTLGKFAEGMAAGILEDAGYKIIARNFYIGHSDIDIVAEIDNVIAFIEVRSRMSDENGTPEESLTPKKIKQMKKTAGMYLEKYRIRKAARLEAVCILFDRNTQLTKKFNHYTLIG